MQQGTCFEASAVIVQLDERDIQRCILLVWLKNWSQFGADTSGRKSLNTLYMHIYMYAKNMCKRRKMGNWGYNTGNRIVNRNLVSKENSKVLIKCQWHIVPRIVLDRLSGWMLSLRKKVKHGYRPIKNLCKKRSENTCAGLESCEFMTGNRDLNAVYYQEKRTEISDLLVFYWVLLIWLLEKVGYMCLKSNFLEGLQRWFSWPSIGLME